MFKSSFTVLSFLIRVYSIFFEIQQNSQEKWFTNADIALLHTATNTIAQGMKTALILTSLVYLYFNALCAFSMLENCLCLSSTCEHAMAKSPTVVELVT